MRYRYGEAMGSHQWRRSRIGGIEPANDPILALTFSPDGLMLASASVSHGTRLWNVATGRECEVSTMNHRCQIPDGLGKLTRRAANGLPPTSPVQSHSRRVSPPACESCGTRQYRPGACWPGSQRNLLIDWRGRSAIQEDRARHPLPRSASRSKLVAASPSR
jgi:hypothetical protein